LLANTILAGLVFGPVVVVLALLIAYGRVMFGIKYKESTKARVAGFFPSMIGEKWMEGLLLMCAIKGILFTSLPI